MFSHEHRIQKRGEWQMLRSSKPNYVFLKALDLSKNKRTNSINWILLIDFVVFSGK